VRASIHASMHAAVLCVCLVCDAATAFLCGFTSSWTRDTRCTSLTCLHISAVC
jgi:hypothetical protein